LLSTFEGDLNVELNQIKAVVDSDDTIERLLTSIESGLLPVLGQFSACEAELRGAVGALS